jgi:hypothetical protein
MNLLGTCPAAVQGSSALTALYSAKYGPPAPGTKIFVHVNQHIDGHESIPVLFSAIVPAAAP